MLAVLSSVLPAFAAPLTHSSHRERELRLAQAELASAPPAYLSEPPGYALTLGVHAAASGRSQGAALGVGLQKWFSPHLGLAVEAEAGEAGMTIRGGWQTHRRHTLLKLAGLLNVPSTDLLVFDFGVGVGPAILSNPRSEPDVSASDFSHALTLGVRFRVLRLGYQSFAHRATACSLEGCALLRGGSVIMLGLLVPVEL